MYIYHNPSHCLFFDISVPFCLYCVLFLNFSHPSSHFLLHLLSFILTHPHWRTSSLIVSLFFLTIHSPQLLLLACISLLPSPMPSKFCLLLTALPSFLHGRNAKVVNPRYQVSSAVIIWAIKIKPVPHLVIPKESFPSPSRFFFFFVPPPLTLPSPLSPWPPFFHSLSSFYPRMVMVMVIYSATSDVTTYE